MTREEIDKLYKNYGLPKPLSTSIIIRDNGNVYSFMYSHKKQGPRDDKPPKDDTEARPRWIQVLKDYCASKGCPAADVETLYDYWREKGWLKDWKAAIRRGIKGGWSFFGSDHTEDF